MKVHKKGVKPVLLSFQTKSGKSGHGGKTHKKCVSENVNGTENPFPTQTAISAYAMSPGFKGGPQKDVVFLFTRPRLWALQLPSVSFKGPPVQARFSTIKFNELSQMQAH